MLKKQKFTRVAVSSALLFQAFLFNPTLKAQDFEVAPVVLDYSAEPGEIVTKTVTIRNHANKKQAFVLQMKDLTIDSTGKKSYGEAGSSETSCANWVSLNPSFFALNPNEEQEVQVLMTVPRGDNSTKWSMMYVKATQERTASQIDKQVATGILVSPRIGVRITQSPKSNSNYSAELVSLKEVTAETDTVRTFAVVVENNGGKIVDAKVLLAVAQLETATEKKTPAMEATILPGERREIKLKLPKGLDPGQYALTAILDYPKAEFIDAMEKNITIE